jgi:hypothetical protein
MRGRVILYLGRSARRAGRSGLPYSAHRLDPSSVTGRVGSGRSALDGLATRSTAWGVTGRVGLPLCMRPFARSAHPPRRYGSLAGRRSAWLVGDVPAGCWTRRAGCSTYDAGRNNAPQARMLRGVVGCRSRRNALRENGSGLDHPTTLSDRLSHR